jgi:hypothetical protein
MPWQHAFSEEKIMLDVATDETKEKEMTRVATDEYQDVTIPPPEMAPEITSSNSTDQDNQKSTKPRALASLREVFSFGTGPNKIFGLIFGMIFACVAGAIGPVMIYYFAHVFKDLVAPDPTSEEFLANVRELSFIFLVLGCVFCRTDECCVVVVKKSTHRGSLCFFLSISVPLHLSLCRHTAPVWKQRQEKWRFL